LYFPGLKSENTLKNTEDRNFFDPKQYIEDKLRQLKQQQQQQQQQQGYLLSQLVLKMHFHWLIVNVGRTSLRSFNLVAFLKEKYRSH